MSGSGHSHGDIQKVQNVNEFRPIGQGQWWSQESFREYFASVAGRDSGDVVDYSVHLTSDGHLYDTHEIYAGPDGMVYFTQRLHDRVGRFTLDGRAELFELPIGSRPHGLRFSDDGHFYVTLENFDQIVELSKRDGSIVAVYSVAFDNPQEEGVVGPHGFAIDPQGRLWYTGRTSDVLGWVDPATGEQKRFVLSTREALCVELAAATPPPCTAPLG